MNNIYSYRNTSESLGDRESLWEHEIKASVFTTFSSSLKVPRSLVEHLY